MQPGICPCSPESLRHTPAQLPFCRWCPGKLFKTLLSRSMAAFQEVLVRKFGLSLGLFPFLVLSQTARASHLLLFFSDAIQATPVLPTSVRWVFSVLSTISWPVHCLPLFYSLSIPSSLSFPWLPFRPGPRFPETLDETCLAHGKLHVGESTSCCAESVTTYRSASSQEPESFLKSLHLLFCSQRYCLEGIR